MKKALVVVLAVFGFLALFAVAVGLVIAVVAFGGKQRVPGRVILEADFEKGVVETVPDDPLAELLMEQAVQVGDVVEALDKAAADDRVKAFVARVGGGGLGLAHIQEIRDAILRFRASGKPAIAYAETFGEFGPGNGGYYLATAFDKIYLQPSGDLGVTGLMYEAPFIRGTLDKLGITPQMDQRMEYKNAMNFYTDREFNAPYEEAMRELMSSQFGQMVRGIAEARKLSEQEVRDRFDAAPYYGQEAVDVGFVDALAYRDEVYRQVREQAGDDTKLLYLNKYLERAGRLYTSGKTIALIHGYGAVVRGESSYSPVDGSATMGADSVAAALRSAVEDDRVEAIVFRVDSPGGSYVASDSIWRETVRARDAGKPVIVTMGNVAGSGGYFVAMDAAKIVAQPGTITASIGVLGGKMVTSGFWDKLGISWDEVHSSEHATMWTGTHPYSPEEYQRFTHALDRIYEDFTGKVAAGRKLPLARVLEIARGRIWTGEDAKALGLVDELGGLDVALRLAREAAGIGADEAIRIKRFPPRRSPWQALLDRGRDNSEDRAMVSALGRTLRAVQPWARAVTRLGLIEKRDVLSMPEVLEAH